MPSLSLSLRRPTYGSGSKTAYTDTAGSSSVPADSNAVIISCSTDAFVAIGKTATTADLFLPAGIVVQLPLGNKNGGPIMVSAIRDISDGNMYCIGCAE
jgi:hypothetical protein